MRIAVIGAGAMGVMFGARFAAAGEDVVLIDTDAAQIAAIAAAGATVQAPEGEIRRKVEATTDPAAAGRADMALVVVDSSGTPAAAESAATILGDGGFALTLQNGIGNVEALTAVLGRERVMAGSTYNSCARIAPGVVLHSNLDPTLIGELDGAATSRLAAVADLLRRSGLPVTVSDNAVGHVWKKFVLNVAINPVSAVTGLRSGQIMRSPAARRLLEQVLDEALAVVAAKGIALPGGDQRAAVLDHAWKRYNRPSMLQHVEEGRRTEIEALTGALLREAAALGIPCLANAVLRLVVLGLEARGRPGTPLDEAALESAARAETRPA